MFSLLSLLVHSLTRCEMLGPGVLRAAAVTFNQAVDACEAVLYDASECDPPIPALIQSVFKSVSGTAQPAVAPEEWPVPAVAIKKSMFPDYIVCLEDGQKLKMLKRHVKTSYNMTPVEYRAKWRLPNDYPMVAPSYAATRPRLAKKIGLGRKPSDNPEVTQVPARRTRYLKR